jgi:hypothetical protein
LDNILIEDKAYRKKGRRRKVPEGRCRGIRDNRGIIVAIPNTLNFTRSHVYTITYKGAI